MSKPTKLYVYDESIREYTEPDTYTGGQRVKAACYVEVEVASETPQSWILGGRYTGVKVPKKPKHSNDTAFIRCLPARVGTGLTVFLTRTDWENARWCDEHGHRVQERVRYLHSIRDATLLREVARLIGYKEER